jgi:hypothetical protein
MLLMLFTLAGMTAAQDDDPTITPSFGALATPSALTVDLEPLLPLSPDDSRATVCTAGALPGFAPHIVREGDRLVDLLVTAGGNPLTPTQIASLNCLDDSAALPVGAVIWLPTIAGESSPVSSEDSAAITAFEVSSATPLNIEGAAFSWAASGAAAYLYPCPQEGECSRPFSASALPLQHEIVARGFQYAGMVRYRLEVVGGDGESVAQDIDMDVRCSQEALAPTAVNQRCPDEPPRSVFAVAQPFEGGVMMYFGDTEEIWVLTADDQRAQVFQDVFEEGVADVEYDDIPDDRVPAIRGFGIIWNQLGGPDSSLGWGLAPEGGIDAARQAAGRLSYTTYIRGAEGAVYAVTFIPGEAMGYWMQITE